MYILLNTLWFLWMLKYVLFWLYLWQLKEYHIGRFIDHFRTYKGRKLVFSFEQILKLVLLIFLFLNPALFGFLFLCLFLIYFIEVIFFVRAIFNKSAKKPIITLKASFLTFVSFVAVILVLILDLKLGSIRQVEGLLIVDILTPIVVSVIVLFFQPFFVLIRNNTLRKAKKKIEKIRSISGLKVIAITGSYGKTSTKEFLSTILSKKFRVLKTDKHQNSEIGVAKCILNDLKPNHQIFIAEVGAYDKGKVKEVCTVLKPEIGIVTGVNEQHLAIFGSLNNLLSAEGGRELADALSRYNRGSSVQSGPEDGILVVNGDNKYCLDLYKKFEVTFDGEKHLKRKLYSLSNKVINSDIWAESIEASRDHISFIAIDKEKEFMHFDAKVLGKHNVQNILGAILIAKELGMSFGEIYEGCRNISQEQAGMILRKSKHGIDVVDSSYSANPDGVFADLDYLSVFPNKKVIIMPCLIELGSKSAEIHEKIGKKIAGICDLVIIISKDNFKELKKGAIEAGMKEENILLCDKPQDIYSIITLFCKVGDVVLLEGRVPTKLVELLIKPNN